jgi:uncharacterized protein involved in response to NO
MGTALVARGAQGERRTFADMHAHGTPGDPYRIFFPLGIALGVVGVSIWLTYWLGLTTVYSGRVHAFVQIEGFLYSFVAGFLLTAIPRFTGTAPPSRQTQYLLAAGVAAASAAFKFEAFAFGHALFLAVHATVIALAASRVRRRRSSPPESFALVGLGMIAGALGGCVNLAVSQGWLLPHWDLLGRRFLTEGMVLLLVLGVGGFLGPRLMGFAALPDLHKIAVASAGQRPPLFARRRVAVYAAAGVAILISLVFEYGFGAEPLALVRAGVASALILATLNPWRLPAVRTTLAWCVWSAHWLLLAGLWLVALAPAAYRVDLLHVMFMGAFTLLILAVGMRVVLSHGGHGLGHERRSWALRVGIVTGLAALAARLAATFAPESYFAHLGIAAMLWIGGMAFWGLHLLRFIRNGAETIAATSGKAAEHRPPNMAPGLQTGSPRGIRHEDH